MQKEVYIYQLREFLSKYDLQILDFNIYQLAFTHGSYDKKHVHNNYQKLEFFGDAILEFVVSEIIYQKFPHLDQGVSTILRSQIVKTKSLSEVSKKIGLSKFLLTGRGMTHDDAIKSQKVNADIYESFIAAIYLNNGIEKTKKFIAKTLNDVITTQSQQDGKDPKSKFQEYIQGQGMKKNPVIYEDQELKNNEGFEAKLIHDNIVFGIGKGKSKSEAEENAALDALNKLVKKN